MKFEVVLPNEIEKRSFEIITEILGDRTFSELEDPIVKRVIHTTADFEYADNLIFSENAVVEALAAIKEGSDIVTDTSMAQSGINKKALSAFGGGTHCFIADTDVAAEAVERGVTRATVSMDKASRLEKPLIFAIGNAPTALIRLHELIMQNIVRPKLIIGVPVGFVNVVESKELIQTAGVPYIVARGRKGGSNVAAAICNALIYMAKNK
ncbi:precorrin-8X methylmutase [Clostridia bacterium]|nr:precorrin-8X methylmutase [Clostridia bacterium]